MLKFLIKKNTSVLGLDIRRSGVNLLEISFDKGRYWVEGFYRESLPVNFNEESHFNANAAISDCIKRASIKAYIQTKQAIVAVPDSAVITNKISVHAGFCEREIEEFIQRDTSLNLPYPRQGMNIDFQVLGPSTDAVSKLDVLVAVSKTLSVNERVQALTQAGLRVLVVDIESYAIERAVRFLKQGSLVQALANKNLPYQKILTGFINVGLSSIQLFVIQDYEVLFAQEEVFSNQASVESLIVATKRLMQFFLSTSQEQHIDEFMIAGEYPNLANLQALLLEEVGIRVQIANPLRLSILNIDTKCFDWINYKHTRGFQPHRNFKYQE